MKIAQRALLALALTCFSSIGFAEDFPTKPIRVIVPFPAGGGTDIITRELTQRMAANTGWTFVVDNKPGAGGNLGVDAAAKSPPNGYTLVIGQTSNMAINPTLYSKLPYDPVKDLAPVALVASAPMLMVVASTSPHKTLGELAGYAKANPGKINYATSGNGTVAHLTMESFQSHAAIKLQHVPYKGASQGAVDLIGGNVDMYISSVPTLIGFVRQDKMRALAITSTKRNADLPNVPTVAELGYPGFEASTWFGLVAPAGTPNEVIAKLNAAVNKALAEASLRKKYANEGAETVGGTAEQFGTVIKNDIARWGKIVKASGARVD